MIAVSNTSPLITLARSGYLHNLQNIFERICIPEAVLNEIAAKEDVTTNTIRESIRSGFIQGSRVRHKELAGFINVDIGLGEAEAIVLSLELKPDYLVIDDHRARVYAESKDVTLIGTLGLIKVLHERNLIHEDIEEIYRRLTSVDFWISKDLFFQVMKG